ncbi:MAG: aspartyl protease family protein [Spirochaetaceae bacterium]|jgi:clan AA aspartic protease|nr:aspartyl protease family protein [Spirochaetaceae bacterium]
MSEVRTEITLVNIGDQNDANRGYIPQSQVRRLTVNAMVNTGAWTLVINEAIREKLGLKVKKTGETVVAGGGTVPSQVTESVDVLWKDRETSCRALVLPGEGDVLLGAIPLEGMDLMVHPRKQEVVGAHGETPLSVVK